MMDEGGGVKDLSVKEEGRGGGSELGSMDPDPQHCFYLLFMDL